MSLKIPDSPEEYVKFRLDPHVIDGLLSFEKRDIVADKVLDDLDINLSPDEPHIFTIDDEQAEKLLHAALKNKMVAKFGADVAARNLELYGP